MASANLQLVVLHEFVSILFRVGSIDYLPNAVAKKLSQKFLCKETYTMSVARKHAGVYCKETCTWHVHYRKMYTRVHCKETCTHGHCTIFALLSGFGSSCF